MDYYFSSENSPANSSDKRIADLGLRDKAFTPEIRLLGLPLGSSGTGKSTQGISFIPSCTTRPVTKHLLNIHIRQALHVD